MNERIRELAKEAGLIPGVMGLNRFTYFDPEKFAELIVGECAGLCSATAAGRDAEAIEEAIRQHFGVDG